MAGNPMNRCRNCGRRLFAANRRYCYYCGEPVGAPTPPAAFGSADSPAGQSARAWLPLVAILGVVLVVMTVMIIGSQHDDGNSTTNAGAQVNAETTTTTDPTTEDTPTEQTTTEPTTTDATDPVTVVQDYYNAVNQGDYQTAWRLGGSNMSSDYSSFVQGYATTTNTDVTVTGTSGDVVDVNLSAQWNDGSWHYFTGNYTVENGVIVHGTLSKTSG